MSRVAAALSLATLLAVGAAARPADAQTLGDAAMQNLSGLDVGTIHVRTNESEAMLACACFNWAIAGGQWGGADITRMNALFAYVGSGAGLVDLPELWQPEAREIRAAYAGAGGTAATRRDAAERAIIQFLAQNQGLNVSQGQGDNATRYRLLVEYELTTGDGQMQTPNLTHAWLEIRDNNNLWWVVETLPNNRIRVLRRRMASTVPSARIGNLVVYLTSLTQRHVQEITAIVGAPTHQAVAYPNPNPLPGNWGTMTADERANAARVSWGPLVP